MTIRQVLEKTGDETSNGHSSQTASYDFIETTQEQVLFDNGNDKGHGRILGLPLVEGVVGNQTAVIVKRKIDFEAGQFVHEFKNRDSRMSNGFNRVGNGDIRGPEECGIRINLAFAFSKRLDTCAHEVAREQDQVDIRRWEIHSRSERAKRTQLNPVISLLKRRLKSRHQIRSDYLLSESRFDPMKKAYDLVVQSILVRTDTIFTPKL